MNIFFYQLQKDHRIRMSFFIPLDYSYWQSKDMSIRSIYEVRSIHQAYQIMRTSRYLSKTLHPIPFPKKRVDWEKFQPLANRLFSCLQGRAYLIDELMQVFNGKRNRIKEEDLWAAMQLLHLQRCMKVVPGVESGRFALFAKCHRCSARFPFIRWRDCATCGEKCAMCNHCYLLGRSRTCSPLFLFSSAPEESKKTVVTQLSHSFTPWQEEAVQKIRAFIRSEKETLLFCAVTGAGKTECMISVIKTYLEQGKRVLWVTPRKDVVLELAPRLTRIFSSYPPIALYGGSPDLFLTRSFVLATAHQAYRYYRYFHLVIIDEADAFPLYRNRRLEAGIERAMTSDAKRILLTATPPKRWKRFARNNQWMMVTLPIRYHGFSLPVPVIKFDPGFWSRMKQQQGQPTLERFVQNVDACDGQAILFVPCLQDLFQMLDWFKHRYPEKMDQIAGVFAAEPKRDETIRQFRQGAIRFLISTTILERGVTVRRCHVAVIKAEHPIFDQATLIQIAGRVGRSAQYQKGEVWLISQEKTDALIHAVNEIKKLNRHLKKAGIS